MVVTGLMARGLVMGVGGIVGAGGGAVNVVGKAEQLLPCPTAISVPMMEIMLVRTVLRISNNTASFFAWPIMGWVTKMKQYSTPKTDPTKQATKPI